MGNSPLFDFASKWDWPPENDMQIAMHRVTEHRLASSKIINSSINSHRLEHVHQWLSTLDANFYSLRFSHKSFDLVHRHTNNRAPKIPTCRPIWISGSETNCILLKCDKKKLSDEEKRWRKKNKHFASVSCDSVTNEEMKVKTRKCFSCTAYTLFFSSFF